MKRFSTTLLVILFACVGYVIAQPEAAAAAPAKFVFPVIGPTYYTNDYEAPRFNGTQRHKATDIIAKKGQKIVAAVSGTIEFVAYPQPYWGYAVIVRGNDNYCYWYIHLNNDVRGTDNGRGGAMNAYGVDMKEGNKVVAGQLLGWVGDSGNAEDTVPHLHFSVHKRTRSTCATNREHDNPPINPYYHLKKAKKIKTPKTSPLQPREIIPYTTTKRTLPNIALGDLDVDGQTDKVIAKGIKYNPMVQVYNSSNVKIGQFYAFSTSLKNGVDVAVGNTDGDIKNEIITATKTNSGAKVAIFQGQAPYTKIREFSVLTGNNSVPRIAAGDVDGDSISEIVVVGGSGVSSKIEVYESGGTKTAETTVFSASFTGGLDVAVGDIRGSSSDEIVVVPLTKMQVQVKILDGQLNLLKEFYAYTKQYGQGAHVAVGNVDTSSLKSEILTIKSYGKPQVNRFTGSGSLLTRSYPIERWWDGYYDIAATEESNQQMVSTGTNRRSSTR